VKLTHHLRTLADCGKARSFSMHDRCRAVYEALSFDVDPVGPKQHLSVDPVVRLGPERARGKSPNKAITHGAEPREAARDPALTG